VTNRTQRVVNIQVLALKVNRIKGEGMTRLLLRDHQVEGCRKTKANRYKTILRHLKTRSHQSKNNKDLHQVLKALKIGGLKDMTQALPLSKEETK
jgi:hypothetical protein